MHMCECVGSHSFHVEEDNSQDVVRSRKCVEGLNSLDPRDTYNASGFYVYSLGLWAPILIWKHFVLEVFCFLFSGKQSNQHRPPDHGALSPPGHLFQSAELREDNALPAQADISAPSQPLELV